MKKNSLIIPSIFVTILAVIVRIYTALFYTNGVTGEVTNSLWQFLNIGLLGLCLVIAFLPLMDIFHNYKIEQRKNKLPSRVFLMLCALGSMIMVYETVLRYLRTKTPLDGAIAIGAIICTIFFIYTAATLLEFKAETLLYFSIGPFLVYILRIIEIFNIYSRKVALYTYKYEISGICALLIFFLIYVRLASDKNGTKSAIFFGLCAFSLLSIYAVPNIVLSLLGGNYFKDPTTLPFLIFDLIMAVSALYFTCLLKTHKTTKH